MSAPAAEGLAPIQLFTIGFTQKPASKFFGLLRDAGVKRVIDVRLNNESQLAGFAKKADLEFFLRELGGIGYVHVPALAPTQAMLDDYKKNGGSWADYERKFLDLMRERRVEEQVPPDLLHGGCLLCSEHEPDHCHRRLVAQYLQEKWGSAQTRHLL